MARGPFPHRASGWGVVRAQTRNARILRVHRTASLCILVPAIGTWLWETTADPSAVGRCMRTHILRCGVVSGRHGTHWVARTGGRKAPWALRACHPWPLPRLCRPPSRAGALHAPFKYRRGGRHAPSPMAGPEAHEPPKVRQNVTGIVYVRRARVRHRYVHAVCGAKAVSASCADFHV